ncbi:hypothetical protein [Accumulibacter sp.]|jgi:hypothetical protein|uniref:hypothetical protein n=1 Tax=Accumulibacter sp. TaxID=2053492 RepID=UPI001AC35171|nr:hypothetical protein [Accumulibacter sp.]MBN8452728.1 hypothetical protein [Accumulibacter sp.]MBO3711725.1 hypothetical protein [Accumulibacter sp.]
MTPAAARVHIREPTLLEEHGGIVLGAAELILESGGDCREELQRILSDIRQHDLRAGEVIRHMRSLLEKHERERHLFAVDAAACRRVVAASRGSPAPHQP